MNAPGSNSVAEAVQIRSNCSVLYNAKAERQICMGGTPKFGNSIGFSVYSAPSEMYSASRGPLYQIM